MGARSQQQAGRFRRLIRRCVAGFRVTLLAFSFVTLFVFAGLWGRTIRHDDRIQIRVRKSDYFMLHSKSGMVTVGAYLHVGGVERLSVGDRFRYSSTHVRGGELKLGVDGDKVGVVNFYWKGLGFVTRKLDVGGYRGTETRRLIIVTIPYWLLLLLNLLAIPLLWYLARRSRRRARVLAGLCTRCAYDLRGSAGETCPECGEPAPHRPAAAPVS